MFKFPEGRPSGEEPRIPRKEFTPSHNGYPATRDPAADGRQGGILPSAIGPAYERRLRQRYAPAKVM